MLAGYDRILKPLACLGGKDGFARFYADFAWPWKWTSWAYERRRTGAGVEWIKSHEDLLNERAERFILGNRYNRLSAARGQLEERPWMVHYEVYDRM